MAHVEDLEGKVAVVTGAASGIGVALARAFLQSGARVVAADVVEPQLARSVDALAQIGPEVIGVETDVRDPGSVEALATATIEAFGRVDVVCNNAGVLAQGRAWEVPLDDWRRVIDVNLFGVVHGIATFVPLLFEQGRPAHIVNTASMGGLVSLPSISPYVASKHAVVALSEVLVADLAAVHAPIGVSVLCPGYVPSRLGAVDRDIDVPEQRPGQPNADDVAADLLDAITSGRFYVFTHEGSRDRVRERMSAILEGDGPSLVALPEPGGSR
jgi:NAD(P)-dependent dehydrogenase (short-subunit alcohol dehydrogenase family)